MKPTKAPTPAGHKPTHQPSQADLVRTGMLPLPKSLGEVRIVNGKFKGQLPRQRRSARDRGIF